VPWVVVALNGLARMYVGAHNPLDVLGGFGLGLLIAGLVNAVLLPAPVRSARPHHHRAAWPSTIARVERVPRAQAAAEWLKLKG